MNRRPAIPYLVLHVHAAVALVRPDALELQRDVAQRPALAPRRRPLREEALQSPRGRERPAVGHAERQRDHDAAVEQIALLAGQNWRDLRLARLAPVVPQPAACVVLVAAAHEHALVAAEQLVRVAQPHEHRQRDLRNTPRCRELPSTAATARSDPGC